MQKIHLIWDLDGTLINSEEEVLDSLKKSVIKAGLSQNEQKVPFRVGPTIDKILDESFLSEILTKQKKEEIIKNFREIYDNCGFNNTFAFEGIEKILKNTQFVHHIVTNKPDLATNRILEKLNWKNYFENVVTPYSFLKTASDKKKTKTELFAILKARYPNEKFLSIGDMATDAKAALENNILSIGVLWGTGTKEELQNAGCKNIVEKVSELEELLCGLN